MPTAAGRPAGRAACVLLDGVAKPRMRHLAHLGTSMFDTAAARRMMVDGQIRTADVTNPDLIAAMLDGAARAVRAAGARRPGLSRRRYRARRRPRAAQADGARQAHSGARRSRAGDHVLDVGCGTGYSSAVLSRLAGSVVALEEDASLARQAQEALAAAGAAQRQRRDRTVDRRLAGGRALRLHFAQWRQPRSCPIAWAGS